MNTTTIIMESKYPVMASQDIFGMKYHKPPIFSIGGFTSVASDGKEFSYDWDEFSSNAEIDQETGIMTVTCDGKGFNIKDFSATNSIEDSLLTPEFILSSELKEVYYECFGDLDERYPMELELVSFGISDDDDIVFMEQVDVARYNARNASEAKEESKDIDDEDIISPIILKMYDGISRETMIGMISRWQRLHVKESNRAFAYKSALNSMMNLCKDEFDLSIDQIKKLDSDSESLDIRTIQDIRLMQSMYGFAFNRMGTILEKIMKEIGEKHEQ